MATVVLIVLLFCIIATIVALATIPAEMAKLKKKVFELDVELTSLRLQNKHWSEIYVVDKRLSEIEYIVDGIRDVFLGEEDEE